jgi:hypothetical protein
MKNMFRCLAILTIIAGSVCAQEVPRDEKFNIIKELRERIAGLEQEYLRPDAADIENALKQNATALRLLPREKYDGKMITRGGGSYYSFTKNTHEYGWSELGLEQGKLKVGFAGADYGFLLDLGDTPLETLTTESDRVSFLAAYKPPPRMTEIRAEQTKAHKYETPDATYVNYLEARVSHTYLVRSISFDVSDVLVGFRVIRKDADGSLILFWKTLKTFKKPAIVREPVSSGL